MDEHQAHSGSLGDQDPYLNEGGSPRSLVATLGLIVGPLLALVVGLGPTWGMTLESTNPAMNYMAAVTILMGVWWLTDAIPMAATGLVPLALFPLLSIMPTRDVARYYGSSMLFLFLGGFLVAMAVERSGLHRRVALSIVVAVGDSPRRLVLGFMVATAVLSMWMSNTATTVMLLPIAVFVLNRARQEPKDALEPDQSRAHAQRRFGISLMLGIAYSASIGGCATLIGTPTNVYFRQFYEEHFPSGPELTFGGWMLFALPFCVTLLLITWTMLVYVLYPVGTGQVGSQRKAIRRELSALRPMSGAERRMACIFLLLALLWITREPVPGWGWAALLGLGRAQPGASAVVEDATVAMIMALVCFVLPSSGLRGRPLLDWNTAQRAPWGILLLFGGGIALAAGMESTGLDRYLGAWLSDHLQDTPRVGMVTGATTGMIFLTELTGNLSCLTMSLPVLRTLSDGVGCDPRLLMIPVTLAASCAFMLPVATPPNAIVYSSGKIAIGHMIRAGFFLNLLSVALAVAFLFLLGVPLWDIQVDELPTWAAG
jgi:sodium-dependent dicarboxylate transporter 2/3/5